jgi:hypothetical protein
MEVLTSRGAWRGGLTPLLWTILLAVLLVIAISPWAQAADSNALELAVKATYLYKFEPFITWPNEAFTAPDSPFNLCIVGTDPFGTLIDQAVGGQHFGDHPIAVQRLPAATPDSHCQMLYIGTQDAHAIMQQFVALHGLPVLTVTDSVDESAAKGVINFVVADNKVRFEIDADAAGRAGISISSKLLSLALPARPKS